MVVRTHSPAYNMILGWSLINNVKATISLGYLLMKFPMPQGMGQVSRDKKKARVCYVSSAKSAKGKENMEPEETLVISGQTLNTVKPQPVETIKEVPLENNNREQLVHVGSQLLGQEKEDVIKWLGLTPKSSQHLP